MISKIINLTPYHNFVFDKSYNDILIKNKFYQDDESDFNNIIGVIRKQKTFIKNKRLNILINNKWNISNIIDIRKIINRLSDIKLIYNSCIDSIDKDIFLRYIKRQYTDDIRYQLLPMSIFPIYYHPKVNISYDSIVIDCGTFTKCFTDIGETFCFEPVFYSDIQNHKHKSKLCIYDKKCFVNMCVNGENTKIINRSNIKIFANTLDNIFNSFYKKIDYIKMDIEGAELNALYGSVNILKRHKPILMISAYHKEMDIIDIPKFLIQFGYKFSFSNHSPRNCDFVLYGIPQ